MKHNNQQNFVQDNLRRQKTKPNSNLPKEKSEIKHNYPKDIKKEKSKETAVYKRRNKEYDIPIPRTRMFDAKTLNLNLGKNRSRNYGNGGLYPSGMTKLQNEIRQRNYKERNNVKHENEKKSKGNIQSRYKLIEDLKNNNFREVRYYSKSDKSQNSNRSNHSYLEVHYFKELEGKDEIDVKLDRIKTEIISSLISSFKNSIREAKNTLLGELTSISNSLKILIIGQNKLIELQQNNK